MFRFRFAAVMVCSFSLLFGPAPAQQPASPPISAQTLLQQSLAAQLGNTQISDVTLTGTVRRIAGSDDESGSVTLKGLSGGTNRMDLTLSLGPRSEIRSVSTSGPSGSWSGPDGVAHAMAYHNVITDNCLFPLFTIASILSNANSVVTLIGTVMRNGQSVTHLTAFQESPLTGSAANLMQHLSQVDIYLDASTNLPASLAYNTHPDNNSLLDIPVELRFSDYRNVNGSQISFHVEKFLNNTLSLDLQFQTAALNTGITAAQVGAQ